MVSMAQEPASQEQMAAAELGPVPEASEVDLEQEAVGVLEDSSRLGSSDFLIPWNG